MVVNTANIVFLVCEYFGSRNALYSVSKVEIIRFSIQVAYLQQCSLELFRICLVAGSILFGGGLL